MNKIVMLFMLSAVHSVYAGNSPVCDGAGETYVAWPTVEPVWEMCYLAPNQSSAEDGSSLEIRNVYYNGHLMLERAHIPLLFANYVSGTCYRDWKDTNSSFLRADRVENPTRPAITTCDASVSETAIVNTCPFTDVVNGGSVGVSGDCITGVQVEKHADYLLLTTNHSAAWYKYSSRFYFYLDGTIKPRFGFGNSDGTGFNSTHRHHAYWRMNFDINGPENDQVFISENDADSVQDDEFFDFRDEKILTSWKIIDSVTQRGVHVIPSIDEVSENGSPVNDYNMPADESMDGYHEVDVMATQYKTYNGGTLPEYSDTPGSNSLGDCSMDETKLVGSQSSSVPETLVDENVVFWYRTAVKDLAGQGMVCKSGGPSIVPVGDWSRLVPSVRPLNADGLVTTEQGDTAEFSLVLVTEPSDDVTVNIVSSNVDEGTVDVSSLLFTVADWDQPQLVTITGQDDGDLDGDVPYTIDMTATSNDADYDGVTIDSVNVQNLDDEVDLDIIFEDSFDQ